MNTLFKKPTLTSSINKRKNLLEANNVDIEKIDDSIRKKIEKLFLKIEMKMNDIDFSNIDRSKGDITKYINYNDIVKVLDLYKSLSKNNFTKDKEYNILITLIENIKKYKNEFSIGYRLDNFFVKLQYRSAMLYVEQGISLLISNGIEIININEEDKFPELIYNKNEESIKYSRKFFNHIEDFNKNCTNGSVSKLFSTLLNKENIKNEAVVNTILEIFTKYILPTLAVLGIFSVLLMFAQYIVYYYYIKRIKMANSSKEYVDMIELNIIKLKNDPNMDIEKKRKIIEKQQNVINRTIKWINFIDVTNREVNKKVEADIIKDKTLELGNEINDRINMNSNVGSSNIINTDLL